MPAPITPIAAMILRYGTVALATYAATRAIPKLRRNQKTEDVLDTVDEGIALRRDPEQINATGRYRRIIRVGKAGPAVEIDATGLMRVKFRRVN
ncbi:MAG: hypothetical protein AAF701_02695 [Pseudomonadota bacterium]